MSVISNHIKNSRSQEIQATIDSILDTLHSEGFEVEIGNIGARTTYALIHTEDHSIEYLGYTFIKDMKYFNPTTGKLKALQQAIARKEIAESKNL